MNPDSSLPPVSDAGASAHYPVPDADTLFMNAFTYAGIGMALVSPDGRWLKVNKSTCLFLGYTEEELLQLTFQDITYPEDLDVDLHYVEQLLGGELDAYQMEKRYIHKSGAVIWSLLNVSLVRNAEGKPHFFISQIQDINERKAAEQALRESEARLALVISETGVGLWDWQIKTGKRIYNARWAEIIGYSLDELLPDNGETWRRLVHADDLARSDQLLRQHFAGETAFYECEVRMKHKDGHWVWVSDRGKIVEWDAEGEPVRMVGTHYDITERKQNELEREQLIAQLQSSLDEVNTLQGILPICSYCKQIRSDEDYWETVESYISARTGAEFSHSICPTCYEKHLAPHLENRRSRPTPPDTLG